MEVRYSRKFLKQLALTPLEVRVKVEHFVFNELVAASSISELGNVEKMAHGVNCVMVLVLF